MMLQLIVGMPNSGKSTFIAALRHLLVANEVPTALELTGLAENEAHLNWLEGKWLSCERVERTKPATEGWVEFNVKDKTTGVYSALSVPDLRGETFEQPACIGQCQKELYEALIQADGVLLFTNADREDDNLMIDDFADIFNEGDAGSTLPTKPFKPEGMPEEIKIVEFLQVANRKPAQPKKRRIAVMVSAWDLIEDPVLTPTEWLDTKRPMLSQFLSTNDDIWEVRVYGVSAQGGKLPEKKDEFEKMSCQSKRVRMVGHDAGIHDLTAPLRWLMSGAS